MTTYTAQERLFRNPDGEVVSEGSEVGGAILLCSVGDEMPRDEAVAQGLVKPTRKETTAAGSGEVDALRRRIAELEALEAARSAGNGLTPVDDKVATAAADQQRADAEKAQADAAAAAGDDANADDRKANADDAQAQADESAAAAAAPGAAEPKGTGASGAKGTPAKPSTKGTTPAKNKQANKPANK